MLMMRMHARDEYMNVVMGMYTAQCECYHPQRTLAMLLVDDNIYNKQGYCCISVTDEVIVGIVV